MANRAIDLSPTGDELIVRFAYHPTLVEVVRGLTRRRFDREAKFWACPVASVVEVIDKLVAHGFVVAPPVVGLYREAGGKGLAEGAVAAAGDVDGAGASLFTDRPRPRAPSASLGPSTPAPIALSPGVGAGSAPDAVSLTVSELNARVHHVLARAFPEMLWVVGEIVGFDRNRHRPHVHFQLMEKAGEGAAGASAITAGFDRAAIRASVDAVLFARTRAALERKLAASDAPFELRDGIEVRLGVRVDLYEAKGSFQLIVEEIDPVHTLGKIAQNRAAVLAELDQRGLRERNSSLPWPDVPLRVGLITSVGSDAYNDFVNELSSSGYAFAITVADARMQGQGLERGLVAALHWFAQRAGDFDALAIVRGGGAKTDLIWFDNLQVALAVANCPIKVISGIGHQRDVSVIDLIAHPEKTPTAAAAAIVARVQAFEQRLLELLRELADRVQERLDVERARLAACGHGLVTHARGITRVERERLHAALARLRPAARERLRAARHALAEARVRLVSLGRAQARLQRSALAGLRRRLDPRMLALHVERRGAKLAALDQLAQSLHPRAVLKRGFAIVRDAAGRTLRDAAAAATGSEIVATLATGRLRARVTASEAGAVGADEPADRVTKDGSGGVA